MSKWRSRLMLIALVAGLSAFVAACGSSDESSDSSGAGAAAATTASTAAATTQTALRSDEPMKIGFVCSCSGPAASSFARAAEFAQAWAKWTNANGGINGYPVEVKTIDDANDAAKALQAVRTLVEEDRVVAIVAHQSAQLSAFERYTNEVGVPVVGGPNDALTYNFDNWFPTDLSSPAYLYSHLAVAKDQARGSKLAVIGCAESPYCGMQVDAVKKLSSLVPGIEVAYTATVTANAPNYTAQCLAMRDAGVDVVDTTFSFAAVNNRLWDNCAAQGYRPAKISSLSSENLRTANSEGAFNAVGQVSQADTTTAGMKDFNTVIDRYAPEIRSKGPLTFNTVQEFAGFQLFKLAAENARLTPSSSYADLEGGLYAIEDETLGGITAPLTYVRGRRNHTECWFVEQIQDGRFVSIETEPECVPEDAIKPLYESQGLTP